MWIEETTDTNREGIAAAEAGVGNAGTPVTTTVKTHVIDVKYIEKKILTMEDASIV